jgi:hypothetical protein
MTMGPMLLLGGLIWASIHILEKTEPISAVGKVFHVLSWLAIMLVCLTLMSYYGFIFLNDLWHWDGTIAIPVRVIH